LVMSSMERLANLLDKAEPILPVEVVAEGGLAVSIKP